MRKRNIIKLSLVLIAFLLVSTGMIAWFVYYGPDNSNVAKKLEAQRYWHLKVNPLDLEQVRSFAKKFGYNEDYYIVCDFGKRSGLKRFYVYDLENGKRIMESYCMHGNGCGSTDAKPMFSNRPGSNASSIGLYVLCGIGSKNMKTSIRLEGLDSTNNNARSRGILIHSSWKTFRFHGQTKYIPIGWESQGCFVITPSILIRLMTLYKFHGRDKRILMWAHCN